MKRVFSMILALILMSMGTMNSFASSMQTKLAEGSEESAPSEETIDTNISKEKLQDILTDIKTRIVILDENAKLNYSMGAMEGSSYYELTWEGTRDVQSVQYGEDRNIYYYNHYQPDTEYNYWKTKKLPQYSMQESAAIAKDFIQKALPQEHVNFVLEEKPDVSFDSYSFRFVYYKNEIPVEGVDAYVIVNYITGFVTNFNTDFSSDISFEEAEGVISVEEAQAAFKKEIGLRKIYTYNLQGENRVDNVRMAYTMGLDTGFAINAKTGKREWIGYRGSLYLDESYLEDSAAMIQPMEQAEIDSKSKLKSMEEATSAAQKLGLFPAKDMEMNYANLYERHTTSSGYLWSLEFRNESETYRVELDAMSLELISFYDYNYVGTYETVTQKNINAAKKAAQDFIKKYLPSYENKLKLREAELESLLGSSNNEVDVSFERFEGGAYLPEDYVTLRYSPASGKIVSMDMQWRTIRLPKPTKFADENIVYRRLFEENGLELTYQLKWNEQKQKKEAKLLYTIDKEEEFPLRFAVTTGERIMPAERAEKIESYSDLSESKHQEEVLALLQIGIGFSGGLLRPSMPITHREALRLFASAFDGSYFGELGTKEEEQLRYYKQIGLLLDSETISDLPVTREELVRYLVRGLGYQKIAVKSEIFQSELYDFEKVSQDFRGYVAIADAIRLLDVPQGGELRPTEQATRDQAIKMLYNFLAFQ